LWPLGGRGSCIDEAVKAVAVEWEISNESWRLVGKEMGVMEEEAEW
jgi:hypothetical protein